MTEAVSVIKEALLTEKATMLSSNYNKYVFAVHTNATRKISSMLLRVHLVFLLAK